MFIKIFLILSLFFGFNAYPDDDCKTKLQECESQDNDYRLSRYKDLYAIFGTPNTKLQLSLKYKITMLADIYLGYTQTMFWELGKQSSPFKDISFNPDFFYRYNVSEHTFIKAIDLIIFEHKSNGKDGSNSRAWSGSGIKFYTIIPFYKWSFNWDTKFYWYYNFAMDETNWDLREYTGFWSTRISFINYSNPDEFVDRVSLYFEFFPGGKYSQRWDKGGQEVGLKFRLGWGVFFPSIFFQFYHGYYESFLDYDKEHTSYRVGIAF